MKIQDLNRNDTLKCKVTGANEKGCFLKIIGLNNENIVGRIFNIYLPIGAIIIASIDKIYAEKMYMVLKLDSIDYSDNLTIAA